MVSCERSFYSGSPVLGSTQTSAARAIDIRHVLHVPQTLFPVCFGLHVVEDTLRKVIGFGHKLRRVFVRIRLIDWRLALDCGLQMLPLIAERRLHVYDAL